MDLVGRLGLYWMFILDVYFSVFIDDMFSLFSGRNEPLCWVEVMLVCLKIGIL